MKKITLILALIVSVAMSAVAQPKELSKEDKEKLFNGKAQMLQKKLGLTDEQMKGFLPVYKEYNEAIAEIKRPQRVKVKPEEMTKEQAYNEVTSQLKFKKDILNVQEKYVGKMQSILTPQQLLMFLKAENAVQMSIRDHKKGRKAKLEGQKMRKMGKKKMRKGKPTSFCPQNDSIKRIIAAQDSCDMCF